MNVRLSLEPHDILVVHLREGDEQTAVPVSPSSAGAQSLTRALGDAVANGYGECFWPGATGGQYWWMFKRDADTLEVITMWTRGGASGWEHTFRATDAATWVHDRLSEELARIGLDPDVTSSA